MTSPLIADSQFALRIERGRTQHPERPISETRFLIGAGSNCHLQLGGEIPILHSVILQVESGLWIDAVVPEPALLVNRQPVRECQIFAGDLIEIGDFVFTLQENKAFSVGDEVSEADEDVDLSELSAENLVDLLAEEVSSLEAIEEARIRGAETLLERLDAFSKGEALPESGLEADLQQRTLELDRREAELAKKAEHLQRAQDRLEKYLVSLAAKAAGDDPQVRRTA